MSQGQQSPTIEQHFTLSLVPSVTGEIEVRAVYTVPDAVSEFRVAFLADITVRGADGFEVVDGSDRELVWRGGTRTPSFVGVMAVESVERSGCGMADAGHWAITQRPQVSMNWRYRGAAPELTTAVTVGDDGTASADAFVVYLGPHETHTRTAAGQTFRLVVPAAASLRAGPSAVLDALVAAAVTFRIGSRDDTVTAIAAPTGTVDWGPAGRKQGASGFWVRDDAPLDTVDNTWLHEYVHTRQSFDLEPDARWLAEATAEYYAGWLAVDGGLARAADLHEHLSTDRGADSVLGRPSSWSTGGTPPEYTKGRRVFAALDAKLRTEHGTDATRLFRRLNDHRGSIDHDALADHLAAVAGTRLDEWLNRYVRTAAVPTVPDSPAALGFGGQEEDPTAGDPGGTGGDTEDPGEPEPPEGDEGDGDGDSGDGDSDGDGDEESGDSGDGDSESGDSGDGDSESGDSGDGDSESGDSGDGDGDGGRGTAPGPAGAVTCPVCERVTDDRHCPGCGTELGRSCPVCGTETTGLSHCPGCGASTSKVCPVCGRQHDAATRYCHGCGFDLRDAGPG